MSYVVIDFSKESDAPWCLFKATRLIQKQVYHLRCVGSIAQMVFC